MVLAALAVGSCELVPGAITPELTPGIADDDPMPVAGPAPMAVVPVEGVVLTALPGVLGPAMPVVPLVPGMLLPMPLFDATLVLEPGPVLPTVLDPSVDDEDEVAELPHGGLKGMLGLVVYWARAAPAPVASAAPASRWARRFMSELLGNDDP